MTTFSGADQELAITDGFHFGVDNASNISKGVESSILKDYILSQINALVMDTTPTVGGHTEGRMYWHAASGTLAVETDVTDVVVQVGQEIHIKVRNETASQIDNGEVVYLTGSVSAGGIPLCDLAQADELVTSEVVGVATADIGINDNGYATVVGLVRDIDTSLLSTGTVWLSAVTAGAMVDAEPQPPNFSFRVGVVTISDPAGGQLLVDLSPKVNVPQTSVFTLPLRGVVTVPANIFGEFREVTSGVTGDYATDFSVRNHHLYLYVNSLTGSGDVTITGTSVDENSFVPIASDVETITVDAASEYYQSTKKWLEIINIDIPVGITAINYDIGVVGYADLNNQSFALLAMRADMLSQGNAAELRLRFLKINDDGNKKMTPLYLEDIAIQNGAVGNQVIDYVRTGGDDRSYNPAVASLWPTDTMFDFKQGDYTDYWSGGEYIFESSVKDEGLIIQVTGVDPTQDTNHVNYITLAIRWRPL